MLADGAHLNISAERALGTILGGEPSPSEDERMSDEEFANWIRSEDKDIDYGESARRLARLYLMALEEGCEAEPPRDMWDVVRDRWPELAEECAGMTGFQHGWALNAARKVLAMPPVPNPALLEIEIE